MSPGGRQVVAGDEQRVEPAAAVVGDAAPERARDHGRVAALAVVGRGDERRPGRGGRARARSRAGRGTGPSASTTSAASTSSPSAARPQRRLAPGPERPVRARDDPRAVEVERLARLDRVGAGRRSRPRRPAPPAARRARTGRSRSCFGEPNRVAAPAARTTAEITRRATQTLDRAPAGSRPTCVGCCCGVAERADPVDDVEALRHLADDRVVRRQARVRRGDDEELAAGRAGGLGRRLRHRDDAVRVGRVRGRLVDRRVARARRCRCRSGRRPGSRSPGTIRWKIVWSKKPCWTSETNEAAAFGDCAWSIRNVKLPQFVCIVTS